MALKFVKTINEGEKLPPFYGIAWWAHFGRNAVCMPVPFNVVARVLRDAWHYLSHPGAVDVNPRVAYREGYAKGRAETFDTMEAMGVHMGRPPRWEDAS